MWVAIAAAATAGVLIGGYLLWPTGGEDSANDVPATPSAADTVASGGSSTSDAPESDDASTPSVDHGQESVVCWDGSRAKASRGCSQPTGEAGLRWVFPSLAVSSGCSATSGISAKGNVWECFVQADSGNPVLVRYSEWQRLDRGLIHYDQGASGARRLVMVNSSPARYVWRYPWRGGSYKWATMYVDYPYSVSVYADSPHDRDWAVANAITFRKPAYVKVRPRP